MEHQRIFHFNTNLLPLGFIFVFKLQGFETACKRQQHKIDTEYYYFGRDHLSLYRSFSFDLYKCEQLGYEEENCFNVGYVLFLIFKVDIFPRNICTNFILLFFLAQIILIEAFSHDFINNKLCLFLQII